MEERFVTFSGRRIWCGIAGEASPRPPLVCVPGGPGAPHDYLVGLAALAESGRQVVFYDPLGAGRSDRPADATWNQEVYVAEIGAVCAGLGITRHHLFAHSAAGLAAFPYALAQPPGLASLVLSSAVADLPRHTAHLEDLLVELGVARDELAAFESPASLTRNVRFARIFSTFMARYLCRIRPIPPVLFEVGPRTNHVAYLAMKGGRILYSRAHRAWDVTPRLAEISAPTLYTCGGHDMLELEVCQDIQRRIPRCELAVFAESSHVPHIDEPQAYLARVDEFLRRWD